MLEISFVYFEMSNWLTFWVSFCSVFSLFLSKVFSEVSSSCSCCWSCYISLVNLPILRTNKIILYKRLLRYLRGFGLCLPLLALCLHTLVSFSSTHDSWYKHFFIQINTLKTYNLPFVWDNIWHIGFNLAYFFIDLHQMIS